MLTRSSLKETFEIFKDPYNLAKITPRWLNFQVTSKNVEIRKGAEIDYNIRWVGLPMHWQTLITEYEPPFLFVDEQAKGPYSIWRHRHTFHSEELGTRVGDHVEYALPFGPLGRIAHALVVKRQLQSIFEFRQRELGKMFGGTAIEILKPVITGLVTLV